MKIVIIGWYGTETIGDRAILAGLLSLFTKSFGTFEIKLGSLFPFFSERTIYEDSDFWKELCQQNIQVEIFNSRELKELVRAIRESDFIVMGGGPLMDTVDLYMIEYAFKKARKLGKKTALLGCGVGPLFGKDFRKSVLAISEYSDLIVLRDTKSLESLQNIYKEFDMLFPADLVSTSFDPAVQCVMIYHEQNEGREQEYIAINLRSFPAEYSRKHCDINSELFKFVTNVSDLYTRHEIILVPMHYFYIGNDDREFLNLVKLSTGRNNVYVQNSNLSLKQTIDMFGNAYFNIGMRFHSVILQTLASGKNYILDYTEPQKGKISGFIEDIDVNKFYSDRYICLQVDTINADFIKNEDSRFAVNKEIVADRLNVYHDRLCRIVGN